MLLENSLLVLHLFHDLCIKLSFLIDFLAEYLDLITSGINLIVWHVDRPEYIWSLLLLNCK